MARRTHERFDSDPSSYAEYLRSPRGRLRAELAWRSLEPHLPHVSAPGPRALDLGAGTGEAALRLASAGWRVTLVDGSPRMLAHAAQAAEARGLAERVEHRVLDLDAGGVAGDLAGPPYDLVLCHDVLEYVHSPEALLGEARALLAPQGRLSVVARNRAGEALKALLRGADPEASLRVLAARHVKEDLYGIELRLFDPSELRALLRAAGLEVVAERGIRVAADYLEDWTASGEGGFERMLALERRLGEDPGLLAVARYVHLVSARASVPDEAQERR